MDNRIKLSGIDITPVSGRFNSPGGHFECWVPYEQVVGVNWVSVMSPFAPANKNTLRVPEDRKSDQELKPVTSGEYVEPDRSESMDTIPFEKRKRIDEFFGSELELDC